MPQPNYTPPLDGEQFKAREEMARLLREVDAAHAPATRADIQALTDEIRALRDALLPPVSALIVGTAAREQYERLMRARGG